MSVKYHKYDIATKMSLVEEYLKLSKESKIAKSVFPIIKEYLIQHLMIGWLNTY